MFGGKFGSTGLWAGRSGETGLKTECPAARRTDSALGRKPGQNTSSVGLPERSGLPPDGPAWGPAWPNQGPNRTASEENSTDFLLRMKPRHL
jgi:hypothetical protein